MLFYYVQLTFVVLITVGCFIFFACGVYVSTNFVLFRVLCSFECDLLQQMYLAIHIINYSISDSRRSSDHHLFQTHQNHDSQIFPKPSSSTCSHIHVDVHYLPLSQTQINCWIDNAVKHTTGNWKASIRDPEPTAGNWQDSNTLRVLFIAVSWSVSFLRPIWI